MDNKNKIVSIVFTVYIFIEFYILGAGMINALVSYRTWRWVGENEFPKFHQVDSALIIPLFVIFFFLSFIPQILLFWFRPSVVPKSLVWLALILNLIVLISTITIQIPIQLELDKKFSSDLIERLISTDMIFRRIPMLLLALTNLTMLYKTVKLANHYAQAANVIKAR